MAESVNRKRVDLASTSVKQDIVKKFRPDLEEQINQMQGDSEIKDSAPPNIVEIVHDATAQYLATQQQNSVPNAAHRGKGGGVYPKPAEYALLIDQLFKRYQSLNYNLNSVNFGSRKDSYKKKLTYYFQNKRNSMKKTDLTGMNFVWRQKRSNSTKQDQLKSSSITTAPPVWGVLNYLPSMPKSEDNASIERHVKLMQEEKKKKYPDIQRVITGMDMTLCSRRKMIVEQNATIQDIKDTYPWLFNESQLMAEMDCLIGTSEGQSYQDKLENGFKKFGMAIVKYGRSLKAKSTSKYFKTLSDKIPVQRDQKEYQDAVTRAAIVMIPTMFREKIGNIFKEPKESGESDEMPSPVIHCSGQVTESTEFNTVADGVVVATSQDLIGAFSCYIAAIYSFNMCNPGCVAKTTLFVERVILELEDNQSIQPLTNTGSWSTFLIDCLLAEKLR
ncbi:LOW QUALITY PROTEIN: uncharacterized protein [Amphiura filiformis]|uniref:LOW QUALITY PROTEIN: uncharacterized protein n=1 Tax=Amphiura filiformis TaxID=82378 RepID=UPI003B221921